MFFSQSEIRLAECQLENVGMEAKTKFRPCPPSFGRRVNNTARGIRNPNDFGFAEVVEPLANGRTFPTSSEPQLAIREPLPLFTAARDVIHPAQRCASDGDHKPPFRVAQLGHKLIDEHVRHRRAFPNPRVNHLPPMSRIRAL